MNTTNLSSITNYVGIDISKQKLDCWLRPIGAHLACGNDARGFDRLLRWLTSEGGTSSNTIICMENTGIYGKRLLVALTGAGWPAAVEKTTVTDKVGPEHGRKEDEYDASLIAEYADRFADELTITTPPEEALEQITQLYSERRRLVRQRSATKTKRTQAAQQPNCPELIRDGWARQIALPDEQIERLEARINEIVEAHEGLHSYSTLLKSIPGVAKVTTWLWLIHFYGQAKLNPKKIAARSASTHCDRFNTYKQRKLEEGKCWPIVRNNLVNKLITLICAIWNSGQPYDPDHTSRFDREKKAA